MKSATMLVTAAFLLAGCGRAPSEFNRPAPSPTTFADTQSFAPPSPTTLAATQAALKAVDIHYGVYLARIDDHITLTPNGWFRSESTIDKSYGPKDVDAKFERTEIREGQLTLRQMTELAGMFAGWDSLSKQDYGGVADGGDITIRYGDKKVSGGSAAPRQVWDAFDRIRDLAATMQVVAK